MLRNIDKAASILGELVARESLSEEPNELFTIVIRKLMKFFHDNLKPVINIGDALIEQAEAYLRGFTKIIYLETKECYEYLYIMTDSGDRISVEEISNVAKFKIIERLYYMYRNAGEEPVPLYPASEDPDNQTNTESGPHRKEDNCNCPCNCNDEVTETESEESEANEIVFTDDAFIYIDAADRSLDEEYENKYRFNRQLESEISDILSQHNYNQYDISDLKIAYNDKTLLNIFPSFNSLYVVANKAPTRIPFCNLSKKAQLFIYRELKKFFNYQ